MPLAAPNTHDRRRSIQGPFAGRSASIANYHRRMAVALGASHHVRFDAAGRDLLLVPDEPSVRRCITIRLFNQWLVTRAITRDIQFTARPPTGRPLGFTDAGPTLNRAFAGEPAVVVATLPLEGQRTGVTGFSSANQGSVRRSAINVGMKGAVSDGRSARPSRRSTILPP